MPPAPTNTGSLPAAVLKVQVGPVVVAIPSLTVAYHSNVWPVARLDQVAVVVAPEATALFWAIWVKVPLANGRPKKVTVSGSASGSDTPTLRVGERPTPVAASAGAFRVGAAGAVLLGAVGV